MCRIQSGLPFLRAWHGAAHSGKRISLAGLAGKLYVSAMERMFEIADRAWLPWRFHGAMQSVLARL
ncbi:MAG: hypothetical protein EP336_17545 [Rhodobacteraceae bacterium]|nr:MAG: hypothetical protein EP336_17545 [Paracoccaceae bacterium]